MEVLGHGSHARDAAADTALASVAGAAAAAMLPAVQRFGGGLATHWRVQQRAVIRRGAPRKAVPARIRLKASELLVRRKPFAAFPPPHYLAMISEVYG